MEVAEPLRVVVEAMMAMASTNQELFKRLWDRYLSQPQPHAPSHMGGDDSVETQDLPSAITLGAQAAIGDPQRGYATGGHVHDMSAFDFLGSLEEICVDNLGQAQVTDANLVRTLEELLLAAYDLRDQVLAAIEPEEEVSVFYFPTKETYIEGVPSGTFPSDMTVYDGVEYNISETTGTPGQDYYFDFEGVLDFNTVIFIGRYDGSPSHTVELRLYDWVGAAWRTLGLLTSSGISSNHTRHIPDQERFIGTGGNANVVRVGFYQADPGSAADDVFIDYLTVAKLVADA